MLIIAFMIGLSGSGNGGGERFPKHHYNEVSWSIGQQQDCRRARGEKDGYVEQGVVTAREEDMHLHLFLFNRSTKEGRYGEGKGVGRERGETKRKVLQTVLLQNNSKGKTENMSRKAFLQKTKDVKEKGGREEEG